jgi:hypothetical protein
VDLRSRKAVDGENQRSAINGELGSSDQREIRRKKRVIEYPEKNGNIKMACLRFDTGISEQVVPASDL